MLEGEQTIDMTQRVGEWATQQNAEAADRKEFQEKLEAKGALSHEVQSLLEMAVYKVMLALDNKKGELPDVSKLREQVIDELKSALQAQGIELVGLSTITEFTYGDGEGKANLSAYAVVKKEGTMALAIHTLSDLDRSKQRASESEQQMRDLLEQGRPLWGEHNKVDKFQKQLDDDEATKGKYLVSGGSWKSYGQAPTWRSEEGEDLAIQESFVLDASLVDKPHYNQVRHKTRKVKTYANQEVKIEEYGY